MLQGFCPLNIKITQFPVGLRLKELPCQLVPFIILNVMDAFAWFELITKEAIFDSFSCLPFKQLVRFFCAKQPAKRICLPITMDSTMWRASLQCFTGDFKVLLKGGA